MHLIYHVLAVTASVIFITTTTVGTVIALTSAIGWTTNKTMTLLQSYVVAGELYKAITPEVIVVGPIMLDIETARNAKAVHIQRTDTGYALLVDTDIPVDSKCVFETDADHLDMMIFLAAHLNRLIADFKIHDFQRFVLKDVDEEPDDAVTN